MKKKTKKSREKEGKVSAVRWQDTVKRLYTQPQEEHDALYRWGGPAKRMAATEKPPASNQQGDWNTRPAKAIAKWEMIRTWLGSWFWEKGKRKKEDLWRKASWSILSIWVKTALSDRGAKGCTDTREKAKICPSPSQMWTWHSDGRSWVKASGEPRAAQNLHTNRPKARTDLGSRCYFLYQNENKKQFLYFQQKQVLWIALLGSYPKELKMDVHTKTCTQMLIAALGIITQTWNQPRCPWLNGGAWINCGTPKQWNIILC